MVERIIPGETQVRRTSTHTARPEIRLKLLLGALLLLITHLCLAQQPYAYPPGYMPYPYTAPTQPQQTPGYNSYPSFPGRQPAYGNWPTSPYGQALPGSSSEPPEVTASLSTTRGYLQQTLLLTVTIASSRSISTLQPDLPENSGLIFKQIDGPTTRTDSKGGKQQVINQFRYAATPIETGEITLPAIRVKGSFAGGQPASSSFEAVSQTPIHLHVLPMDPSVQPWLPLHGLVIQAIVQNLRRPEVGKPISLVVDISAVGASGSQLPSLEERLKESDFRVYREKSTSSGTISADGGQLIGQRTEVFTLVPQHGGKVLIPELIIPWWNVDTHRRESGTVPIKQLLVKGAEDGLDKDGNQQIDDLFPGASSFILWVPLIGVFSLTVGFWILAWLRQRRFIQVVEEEIAAVVFYSFLKCTDFITWLAPIRRLQRLRQLFVSNLPRSFRLWFCIRLVNGEDDPEVWAYMLRFLTHKHLGIPTQLPLPELGRRLAAAHPLSREAALEELMQTLDAALYNGGAIDFTSWKQRFRRELRPSLFRRRKSAPGKATSSSRLPPLNPGST